MSYYIKKASGETERFSTKKLKRSLMQCGADRDMVQQIMNELHSYPRATTTMQLHEYVEKCARKRSVAVAARYRLKRALFELGPSGFPFEQLVAQLFRKMGYTVRTNQLIRGKCIFHEVDVVTEKDTKQYMIECKFHNQLGSKSNVKVPLYIHSRFLDIKERWENEHKDCPGECYQGMIVTNTKFSGDAITYSECTGLKLIGWSYPREGNLEQLIDRYNVHPITVLSSLTTYQKQQLIKSNILLCSEVLSKSNILKKYGIKERRLQDLKKEVHELCREFKTIS